MWNKELVELLLIKYQENENLYNVKDPVYLDRVKRSNSLFNITEELKKINKDITLEAVKKKIHSLRTQYTKESREVANSKRSGVGAEDVYEPKLWCFGQMEFLKSHCAIRKSESNIFEMNESMSSITPEDQPVTNNEDKAQHNPNKRKKTYKLGERIDSVKDILTSKLQEKSTYDWLGKQVVFEINQLKSKKLQRDTAWKIQQILREALVEDEETEAESNSSGFQSQMGSISTFLPSCSNVRPPSQLSDNSSSSYGFQSQMGSKFTTILPSCSIVRPPSQLSDNSSSSYGFVPVRPFRPTSDNFNTLHSLSPDITVQSSLSSPDILQQSLEGLLDDEDF